MSELRNSTVSEFCLEGRFIDFVIKDGYKLKGLLLATAEGECYVKLGKHLRMAFDLRLPKGTWLQVVGTKKYDRKKDETKLVAEGVMAARGEGERGRILSLSTNSITQSPELPSISHVKAESPKIQATILVCQKSDCMNRGGKALCQALETTLSDRGLQDQVTIKGTGCMKNCKAGPNLVMPDKTRYSRIQAAQVSTLIDKHFGEPDNCTELAIPAANLAI